LDFNASQGEITLFEGNGATQNVVCNLFWENTDKFWNFEVCFQILKIGLSFEIEVGRRKRRAFT
jgi:hypothetical protein